MPIILDAPGVSVVFGSFAGAVHADVRVSARDRCLTTRSNPLENGTEPLPKKVVRNRRTMSKGVTLLRPSEMLSLSWGCQQVANAEPVLA